MMAKMGDEFPQCPRVHTDWEFALLDKITKIAKNTKKFRIVAIQDCEQNLQHVAVIISELSNEYVQLPEMVERFLSQLKDSAEAGAGGGAMPDALRLQFTNNVYLYTDKLLVSEDVLRKHFGKSKMVLQLRVDKQNLAL